METGAELGEEEAGRAPGAHTKYGQRLSMHGKLLLSEVSIYRVDTLQIASTTPLPTILQPPFAVGPELDEALHTPLKP